MKKILVLLLLCLSFSLLQAQRKEKKIKPERIVYKGLVVDQDNEPLAFVNVFMAKGKFGTTTDINGEFELKTRRKRGKLTFSAMGYETKIIKVNPQKIYYKVLLKEKKNVLDEVVIVKRPKKRLKKKENPAYKILKQIWKHRKKKRTEIGR